MAEAHSFVCSGTFHDTGYTYYGKWGHGRIDYMLIPLALMHQVRNHKMLLNMGRSCRRDPPTNSGIL